MQDPPKTLLRVARGTSGEVRGRREANKEDSRVLFCTRGFLPSIIADWGFSLQWVDQGFSALEHQTKVSMGVLN